jgi:ABC-2 type transport system ATP-binding protein
MNVVPEEQGFVIFKEVSKRFRGYPALDRISFSMQKGEIFGYIGPNGAGKTTTMKIAVGLITNFEGKVLVGGRAMPKEKVEIHKILGYMPQSVSFQEWRTVEHALTTFGLLSGLDKKEIDGRIESVLKLIGISDLRHRKIVELSGGNIQKVGFAQALVHNPGLLVLDEPLSGLDPESRHNVKRIIKDLGKRGTTIIFSSHILSDVQDVATKIGIISQGWMMKVDTLDGLKAHFSAHMVIGFELVKDAGKTEELKSIPGVTGIERPYPNRLHVHIEKGFDADEVSRQILNFMVESGYHIRSFGPLMPNLDDLYLQYVYGGARQ